MKILIISDDISKTGGLTSHVELLVKGLIYLNNSVDLIYPVIRKKNIFLRIIRKILFVLKIIDKTDFYRESLRLILNQTARKIKKQLNSKNYDIISAQSVLYALAARKTALELKKKAIIILTMHGYFSRESTTWDKYSEQEKTAVFEFSSAIEKQGIDSSDGIICVSGERKNYAISEFGYNGNIAVIRNAVDTGIFCPAGEQEKFSIRKKLKMKTASRIILIPRRLVDYYVEGIISIIDRVKLIKNKFNVENLIIYIAGNGPEFNKLENHISSKNLRETAVLLGEIPHAVIHEYYKASDLIILPKPGSSIVEGLSMSLIEAMACGKVVIASRAAGAAEIIQNSINGFLIDSIESDEFDSIINEMVTNKIRYDEISNNAGRLASNDFNHILHAKKYTDFFDQIIKIN